MQQSTFQLVFAHPLSQLLTFCCLFFCGEAFCFPFLFVIRYALMEGEPFAILGLTGLLLCLASLFTRRFALQGWGLLCMWASLVWHFLRVTRAARINLIQYPLQYIILFLFLFVTAAVIIKYGRLWKNY